MALPEGYHDEHWIYAGRRLLRSGKQGDALVWADGTLHVYEGVKINGPVGATYAVGVKDDQSTFLIKGLYGPRYVKAADKDDPRYEEWCIAHRVDTTAIEMRSREAREKKSGDALRTLVAPLRAHYQKEFLPSRQAALLAVIIQEITR